MGDQICIQGLVVNMQDVAVGFELGASFENDMRKALYIIPCQCGGYYGKLAEMELLGKGWSRKATISIEAK